MRLWRRGIVVLTTAIAIIGCSGTHAGNNPTALDKTIDDRSLLSFIPAALDHTGGSFEVRSFSLEGGHLTPHARGHFWTTPGSNVYTAVNVRRAVVDRAVESLLARPGRRDINPDVDALLSPDGTYYRGYEFQYGFGTLVLVLGIGAVTTDAGLSPPATCREALERSDRGIRKAANRLTPRFVADGDGETWRVPVGDLLASNESARNQVIRACGTTDDYVSKWTLRMHRRADTLRVFFDPGNSTEPTEQEVLQFTVSDFDHQPSRPAHPEPAIPFTTPNLFILKVSECGTLPWEFSNFMAGNRYTPPNDPEYVGPSVFSTDFLCAPEVPADKR
jgi:hypothetical protein